MQKLYSDLLKAVNREPLIALGSHAMQVALISASVVCLIPPRYPNQNRDAPM